MFSGFCYTQFADTFQEANGLLREDRTPKIRSSASRGPCTAGRGCRPRRLEAGVRREFLDLGKPDGRRITLYGNEPVTGVGPARAPAAGSAVARRTCVGIRCATNGSPMHRTGKTGLSCRRPVQPLASHDDPSIPTELPEGRYDVAVFDNLFPALSPAAQDAPELHVPTCPRAGAARSSCSRRTAKRRWPGCRSPTSRCCSKSWATGRPGSRARSRCAT